MEAKSMDGNLGAPNGDSIYRRWLERQTDASRRNDVFTVTVDLTPELAELLLANNPSNRNISEYKAFSYAEDIWAGRWQHNGEPIIIADTGELNDGQHRCRAVIIAKKSIRTQMTFGVARSTRNTLDIGLKRSIGQHLHMAGYVDGHHLGHTIALIMGFERRQLIEKPNPQTRPTTAEILEWADKHDIHEHLRIGANVGRIMGVSFGVVSAISYLLHEIDRQQAGEFFELLRDGISLEQGSPILSLRNQFIRRRGQKGVLPWSEQAALIIKTWNLWRTGQRRVRSVSWHSGGGEKFPIPE